MKRLALALLLLAVAAATAEPARASCVAVVVVDGWALYGRDATGIELPPRDGVMQAVVPACNDAGQNDPDTTTTVVRLKGVPANVAVVSGTLYIAEGSLTALRSHPVHIPSLRAPRRECGRPRRMTGVVDRAGGDSVNLLAEGRNRLILVDARTRLTNRPAYQPLLKDQRVEVTTRRCRNRVFADRIALSGPAIAPPRYGQELSRADASFPWGWVVSGGLGLLLALLLVERVTRPR